MVDILKELFEQFPYSPHELNRVVFGDKNVGIMLNDGSIGVCSTLCNRIAINKNILANPDFSNYQHRVVMNAWVNAKANYREITRGHSDIFNAVDYKAFSQVAMVGYFGSLTKKFADSKVNFKVFDLNEDEKPVEPLASLNKTLGQSDAVILTATSISNNTINSLLKCISSSAKVFILGPSTPLTSNLFAIPNIVGLFGARFSLNDDAVLSAIGQGGGTRSFLSRMEKVYLLRG